MASGDCVESLETIAGRVAQNLGYDSVKAEQMKVIASVMHVRDVFLLFCAVPCFWEKLLLLCV